MFAGFSGHGYKLGPISGKLVAELIATGSVSCSLKEHYFKKGRVSYNH
jgi:glycine/D-amino acid oxidase-like deaminating enzyme